MSTARCFISSRLAGCLSLLVFFTTQNFGQNVPPKAPVREVTDTYFDTKIVDPYRWMEDAKGAEMVEWMKAQNAYARSVLDRLPMRNKLLKRLEELSNITVSVTDVQKMNGKYFYYKLAPGENDRKLYVRDSPTGAERLLVDPRQASRGGKRYSVNFFKPSQDGKYVAYGVSAGGSEDAELRVVETATGRNTGERIDRARFPAVAWLPHGRSFFYNRLQKLAPDEPPTERLQKSRVFLHTVGSNPEQDTPVFGHEVSPTVKIEPAFIPAVITVPNSQFVFGYFFAGVEPNMCIYTAPLASVGKSPMAWRMVADFADDVFSFDVHGDELYLLTHRNTPRYKVIRTSVANPDLTKAQVVVPASEAVVTDMGSAGDALYVQTLDGGIGRLLRVDFKTGKSRIPQPIRLPRDASISNLATDPREPGVLLRLASWTKSPTYYVYDPARKEWADTKLQPASPIDFSDIESVEVKARSYDGTMIPLSIIYKRGLKRDGQNPTLMVGYGAYGISIDPAFNPLSLGWLERGGVYAYAHVRGGGEYGEEWHLAGRMLAKMNTVRDFIACAEYVVRENYTSPGHLAGLGRSAGGILIGGAITERPDLFGAAIINVGDLNVLRSETTPNGVPNIPEFGTVKTPEGFKGLLAMDAYHRVKDGVAYPAVLLTTGINDSRVEPWMSAKMAARLQAATTSGKPVLLSIDYNAGHFGIDSTKRQLNEQLADTYSFLFQQLGAQNTKSAAAKK